MTDDNKERMQGYCYIKYFKPNGVLLEIWNDEGKNDNAKPTNTWKKLLSEFKEEDDHSV